MVVELNDIAEGEKSGIELRLQSTTSHKGPTFRLRVWEDGWVWFDGRESEPKAGWKWQWTTEGWFSQARTMRELLDAAQLTRTSLGPDLADGPLSALWIGLLTKERQDIAPSP
jgi:hypothetical protein